MGYQTLIPPYSQDDEDGPVVRSEAQFRRPSTRCRCCAKLCIRCGAAVAVNLLLSHRHSMIHDPSSVDVAEIEDVARHRRPAQPAPGHPPPCPNHPGVRFLRRLDFAHRYTVTTGAAEWTDAGLIPGPHGPSTSVCVSVRIRTPP
ncbi:hypothetical protein C8035_v001263 [Colletotrichum spinosum]|uniref:Uncharacterized protein n=1 Tax=Colletotrichum spinosum TaxID=1347390 RepID=A0A4R8QG97_9PEZI|nr:hypothetical protein C8035_v001263 [Colletotrichum spinosum]